MSDRKLIENYRREKTVFIKNGGFVPYETQRKFMFSKARMRFYIGGFGSGKTGILAYDTLRMLTINAGMPGLLIGPTHSLTIRVVLEAFLKIVPEKAIRRFHRGQNYIELVNGSKLWVLSFERPDSLDGVNAAFASVDEARMMSKQAWTIVQGRVRHPRAKRLSIACVSTPMFNGWLEKAVESPDAEVFNAASFENTALPAEYLRALENNYSEQDKQRFIFGKFVRNSGLVYPDWSNDENAIDFKYDHAKHDLYCTIDFGYNQPAVLWVARIPDGDDFIDIVIDELVPNQVSTERLAEMIIERNAENNYNVLQYFGDRAGLQTHGGQASDISVFSAKGIGVSCITQDVFKDIPTGISLMRARIKAASGKRRLFVSRDFLYRSQSVEKAERGFIKDIGCYVYDENAIGKAHDRPAVRQNRNCDHTMDAIRYILIALNAEMIDSSGMVLETYDVPSSGAQAKSFEVPNSAHDLFRRRGHYEELAETMY